MKRILSHLDDLAGLAGLGLITYAGSLIHPAAGFFLAGVSLLVIVTAVAWIRKSHNRKKRKA